MKSTHRFILPAVIALAAASLASAREPEIGRPQGPPPDPLARAIDANADRVIDAAELAAAATALQALDGNGDGALTPDEFAPPPPPAAEPRANRPPPPRDGAKPFPPPSPFVVVLDADRDGVISAEEIEGAPAALATLDRNGDGRLAGRELAPGGRRTPRDRR